MTIESRGLACLDEEVLAAFADGRLKRSEIPAVLAHLRGCPRCMSALQMANEIVGVEAARPFRWWVAAAAAAVIAAVLVAVPLLRREESPIARVVRYAPAGARPVETRLTPLAWAPYRGPLRTDDPKEDATRLQLGGAAGDAVARANVDASADAQWTAGVALLLVGESENALKRLTLAAERAPNDSAKWSDLAAALDATAIRLDRKSLHAEALAASDRALAIDASHPPALFNRALILEHLGLGGEARKAWDRYLAVDPSSSWATEAREHLRRLPVSTGDARFRAAQTNLAQVATLVPAFPQQSRTYAESVYLGRWGATGDVVALDSARGIGEMLEKTSGESLLREAVGVIDASEGEKRRQLAAAHALYDRARVELSRQEPVIAARDLRSTAAVFDKAASPMALVARYFAACARFEAGDVTGAREELEHLRGESDSHPGYLALRAQINWQLATIAFADADWSGALERLNEAEQTFRRLGERSNLAFIRGMQSTAMGCLGRPDEAWSARIEAFSVLDAEGHADRLPVTLGGAARMELHAGRLDTAGAFLRLEVQAVRDLKNNAQLTNALVRETLLHAQSGDYAAAAAAAHEARSAASSLSGPSREIADADADVALGAVELAGDAAAARNLLTAAIDFYRATKRMLFVPQACLLRARASLRLGDRDSARRDLDEGIDVLDRHRGRLDGPLVGTDMLDAGAALTREAIGLCIDEGDVAGAFREAERRNLRTAAPWQQAVTIDGLQRRLHGTASAVMMLLVLQRQVLAITITETSIATARAPLDERALSSRARGAEEGRLQDAEALYDALIRPSEGALSGTRLLIFVADPLLREIPFAALHDRVEKRYLVEAMAVAVAESASTLRAAPTVPPPYVVAIALPRGDLQALPDTRRELVGVTALYDDAASIEPASATFAAFASAASRARIVHVAGHTSRERGMNEPALPFAGHDATWRDLASVRFQPAAVVTLAACDTLRDFGAGRTSARSLGGGVLAGGAGDVVGTLAPIADRDAADIFLAIHRRLAAGMDAAGALRQAQLAAIATETATGRPSPWRSVALWTQHI